MAEATPSFPQTLYQPEEGACQILLIRHGQSAPFTPERPFNLVDGHGDPHLTELGHHQAHLARERLANEPIEAIYATSLTRTSQTAAPLAASLSLETRIEPDLREVFLGDFEGGLLRQRSTENHPAVVAMRASGEWGEIPGAETNVEFTRRTVRAVERIAGSHPDQLVAVFCHGGVVGAVLGHVAGVSPFTFNGSRHTAISHLVANPTGWVIRSFNDGAHAGLLTVDHQLPG
ncbi:MAG: histidine phosphatase family protein [Actinomycetia bacterium]|nr:histidine phosphatase family protein [Actinomycetes bacterium]